MKHIKVQGHDNLVRDSHSKAILNTDVAGLQRYLAERDIAEKQRREKQELVEKVNNLEKDMSEIKNMLYELTRMRTPNGN
jgi:hypothetical protein